MVFTLPRIPTVVRTIAVGLVTVAVGAACGDGGIDHDDVGLIGDTSADVSTDVSDEVSEDADTPSDTVSDIHENQDISDVSDTSDSVDPVDPEGRCNPGFACDQRLDDNGRCPGLCRDVDGRTRCRGTVVDGLCEVANLDLVTLVTETVDFGDFTVTPIAVPSRARIGETHRFEVHLRNDTDRTLDLPFYWKTPGQWRIDNASWDRATGFRLPPRVTVALTADITALSATVFVNPNAHIVSFNFAERTWEAFATIDYSNDDALACGDGFFPPTFCFDESCTGYGNYYSARCCDGVFYPGAQCCEDSDCHSGSCAEGRCIHRLPFLGSANSLPLGHQRIVLVLVDTHPEFSDDPCADRSDLLAAPLELATSDNWFHTLSMRRLGREAMAIEWTVLAGIQTADFQTGDDRSWWSFSGQLDTWLADRGCPILGEYDKVIVSAPTVDLFGFGGVYFSKGEIAVQNPWNPLLLAHELAHAWGATDLYLDLGGRYQFARSLMASWLSSPPAPDDSVVWAEMGYGDINHNQVIDIVEYAAFPESLGVRDARAVLTPKETLEISFDLIGYEDGVPGRVYVPVLDFSLPGFNFAGQMWVQGDRPVLAIDRWQVDLAQIIATGSIAIDIVVTLDVTDRDWQKQTLVLDTRLQIPLTDER